jgi:lipopolysaccharide/colanic/teichoic acid biosynthesis glycosyltransferase
VKSIYPLLKRVLDMAAAIFLLLVLSPLFLAIVVAVRLTMGSPVLFRQLRPGLNEAPFICLKFRTMREASDAEGRPLADEHRLTRLGLFLRRTSLDELPQLWNILRGELSFIGPRALLMQYLPFYTQEEHRRHSVRPGLSGWAQVHGRNYVPFDKRLAMDVWYVDHLSPWLDLRILLMTVWVVLVQQGFKTSTDLPLDELRSQHQSLPRAESAPAQISHPTSYHGFPPGLKTDQVGPL